MLDGYLAPPFCIKGENSHIDKVERDLSPPRWVDHLDQLMATDQ